MRSPGRSIPRVALLRRFALVLPVMLFFTVIGTLLLIKVAAPDWSYYVMGIVFASVGVFRTMEVRGRPPEPRR
jgi:hypothetical protein